VYLQVRVAEYSNVKTQLSTTLRKQSGRYFMLCHICLKWAVTVITLWNPYCSCNLFLFLHWEWDSTCAVMNKKVADQVEVMWTAWQCGICQTW
jgi:hypothetical protein